MQRLLNEVNQNSERAKTLLLRHGEGQWKRRPPKGGWSAVECVEHLTLTTGLYEKVVAQAVNDAKQKGLNGNGPFTMDLKGKMLKWVLEPPYRMKVKTSPLVDVKEAHDPNKVLEEFLASQERLCAMISSAEGLALDAVRVTSPFNKKMKYNLYSALSNILAHQRRHLWQAGQALASHSNSDS